MTGDGHRRVALITGAGRERGIGRACAQALAADGTHVVVTDLVSESEALAETAAACRAHGVDAIEFALDVTDAADVDRVIGGAASEMGGIDVIVNNAGTAVGIGDFSAISDRSWELSWQVNVMGIVRVTRAALPHLRKSGSGAIVNISSMAGLGASRDFAGYTTTKFAVVGLTKSMALDFAPDGIRANAVCPGLIDTQIYDDNIDAITSGAVTPDDFRSSLASKVPLGRWARSDEVGDVVTWLAGPASGYVTGVALPVAGGLAGGL